MSMLYGLSNRVLNAAGTALLQDPRILNYLHYTSIEDSDVDLFAKEPPSASEIINKRFFIGRRIPINIIESGAYMDIRVATSRPEYNNTGRWLKVVQLHVDVICHQDCQVTLRGTRDITIMELVQDVLRNADLTGIGDYRVISLSDILGLKPEYSGYALKIEVAGFSKDLYD